MQKKVLINVKHNIIDPSTIMRLTPVQKYGKTKCKFDIQLNDGKFLTIKGEDETELRKIKGEVTSAWLGSINGEIKNIGE